MTERVMSAISARRRRTFSPLGESFRRAQRASAASRIAEIRAAAADARIRSRPVGAWPSQTRADQSSSVASRRSSAVPRASRIGPSSKRSTSSAMKPSITSRVDVRLVEPARAQVEELLLVDLRDRRGVRAADVVGEDLEARDRVGVRLLGEQQVAALLERVGLLRARVDLDHPAPDRARAVGEDAAEGEVRRRVRRAVLLRGVEVDVLARVRRVGAGDLRVGARAGEQRLHAHLAARGAEAEHDPVERAVALDLGALGAEDPRALVELLGVDVAQVGVLADLELDDRVEHGRLVAAGEVLLPDLGLGALLEHDQHAPVQDRARRRRRRR